MLKLICGPSGAGKTELLVRAIEADVASAVRCFLLVPEQQAYISERDLTARLPGSAGRYLEIVNFSRLAEDVFRVYGGVAQQSVGGGARALLMWDTLRRLSPELKQYGRSAGSDPTLTARMLAAVEELRSNGIAGEQLEGAAGALPGDSPLRAKLLDLARVDATFRESAGESLGAGVSERLLRLAELLREHDWLAGAQIYIDSFTSFTAPEYAVLRELLRQAAGVTVALCTDGPDCRMMHFEGVNRTARRLLRMAEEAGLPAECRLLPPSSAGKPAALRILERELWDFGLTAAARTFPPAGEPQAVHTLICTNLYAEAEACAVRILGLVQQGLRYGDIAVVVRDTETYRGVLDAALERHGIPYFFSERTDLSCRPLARLVLSALRAVNRHYRLPDILTLLKTNLCGADMREVALFEEYCETWHITGSRMTDSAWSMNPDGLTERRSARGEEILAAANRVRKTVMEPLLVLSAAMRASDRLDDRCRAVYDYLCRLNVSARLSERARQELALGQRREAGESVRLYRFLIETLTGLCALLPDARLSAEEFLSALTLYFSATDLGSVPNLHDCVTVGSAATLRVENVRVSFLLGLCEGEFPQADSDDGILTEADKDTLESLGLTFDSRRDLRSSEELFYVYRAMTKPYGQLFLSCPAMQPDGSARTPSVAFARAGFLFGLTPARFGMESLRPQPLPPRDPAHRASPLPPQSVLRLSQSAIQAFVLCPYRYHWVYRLGLRERKDSAVGPADEGTFLHYVFERLLRGALGEDGALHLPPPAGLPAVADRIIAEYLADVCPIPPQRMDRRLLHLFARLRGLALLMLEDITGEIASSRFRPARFEQRLGGSGQNDLPPLLFPLSQGCTAELRGLVDRVDLYAQGDKTYVRVVDYKTGRHSFSPDGVRSGADIQLVLYLAGVTAADPGRLLPGGAQYLFAHTEDGKTKITRSGFLLDDPDVAGAADTTGSRLYSKNLIPQSAAELTGLIGQMQDAVCTAAERILAGEAGKTPSEQACRFCPVRAHCDVAWHGGR